VLRDFARREVALLVVDGDLVVPGSRTVLLAQKHADPTLIYRIVKSIAEHDGAIVKTIGDAVMAVFRSAADGLLAMLEVQQALAEPGDGSSPLQLKAGLNTGPCIAVTLNDRLDYFGSTVNMAARLEGLSSGSDVIISRTVFEDARVQELIESDSFDAMPFDMELKGFENERFELWRVSRR
jgi:class 3 adenylate cyclase